ncbi:MAG: hypothetical protein M3Q34_00535 [bacterium]|nr:hypothetical protein [bacterium]
MGHQKDGGGGLFIRPFLYSEVNEGEQKPTEKDIADDSTDFFIRHTKKI